MHTHNKREKREIHEGKQGWENIYTERRRKTVRSAQQNKRMLDHEHVKSQLLQRGQMIFNGTKKITKQENDKAGMASMSHISHIPQVWL